MTLNEDVERVRRAHRNDMENIFVFFALAAFYVTTGPAAATANWLFRIFTIARYVHTFVYVNAVGWVPFTWIELELGKC